MTFYNRNFTVSNVNGSPDDKNKIFIDFTDNMALRDALGQKRVGDKFEVTIKGQVTRTTEEGFEGTIDGMKVPGYVEPPTMAGKGDNEITPDAEEEPVMVMVRGKRGAAKGY